MWLKHMPSWKRNEPKSMIAVYEWLRELLNDKVVLTDFKCETDHLIV